ncbi:hypothetical protein EC973_002030 [Apophysomyces ossiformis]|uniref:Uncharacterized protein n=1 Tax=Apophysomyces ossiformis TaxID=679940 RepID=A0A8H7BIY6_9FUNG|nr:hypothetical protein EC973_002030 [Apophysomyces ossiformis]
MFIASPYSTIDISMIPLTWILAADYSFSSKGLNLSEWMWNLASIVVEQTDEKEAVVRREGLLKVFTGTVKLVSLQWAIPRLLYADPLDLLSIPWYDPKSMFQVYCMNASLYFTFGLYDIIFGILQCASGKAFISVCDEPHLAHSGILHEFTIMFGARKLTLEQLACFILHGFFVGIEVKIGLFKKGPPTKWAWVVSVVLTQIYFSIINRLFFDPFIRYGLYVQMLK